MSLPSYLAAPPRGAKGMSCTSDPRRQIAGALLSELPSRVSLQITTDKVFAYADDQARISGRSRPRGNRTPNQSGKSRLRFLVAPWTHGARGWIFTTDPSLKMGVLCQSCPDEFSPPASWESHPDLPVQSRPCSTRTQRSLWVTLVGREGFEPPTPRRAPGLQPGCLSSLHTDPCWLDREDLHLLYHDPIMAAARLLCVPPRIDPGVSPSIQFFDPPL